MSLREATETIRADDFLEYFLFPGECEENEAGETSHMENLLREINEEVKTFIGDHIWQKDPFQLIIRTKASQLLSENKDDEELPLHFHGITFYGENIQDEWFIVELIFHLTRKISGLVGRVVDADGEFMMIEAADHLPKWANPDTCTNRVYIHNGNLLLLDESWASASSEVLVAAALTRIRSHPNAHIVPKPVIESVQKRFADSKNQRHRVTMYLPATAALILRESPQLIAPAVRAFCSRDQFDLKACRAMKHFPPEVRVYVDVAMTRCLYAMLMHFQYTPDRRTGWNLPQSTQDTYKAHTLGVKVACGLEILASKGAAASAGDLDGNKSWHQFLKRLNDDGYFGENIEHSKEHTKRLENAKEYFKMFSDTGPVNFDIATQEVLKQIEHLRASQDSFEAESMQTYQPNDDSDDWLNISADELDKIMSERYGIKKTYRDDGDDMAAEANSLTNDLQTFLNTKSEFDGVEVRKEPFAFEENASALATTSRASQSSSGVNFDPDAFQNHLKHMLDFIIPEDNFDSQSDMSDFDDEDVGRHIEMMESDKAEDNQQTLATYMKQMDEELARTTIGKSFIAKPSGAEDDFDDIESFTPVDIDVNALKNLSESYQAQLGGHGPAASMLSSLGIRINVNPSNEAKKTNEDQPLNTQV